MDINNTYSFIALGILAGILSGLFGIGGGIILVPALIWIFGFTQHQAQGISLTALLLPVGILGFMTYYKAHPFPVKTGLWIALGIFVGAFLGSLIAQQMSTKSLRISFGVLMIIAACKMIFGR